MRIAVYPGSFDPITNGHIDIIQRSLRLFDKVIVGISQNSSKQSLFSLEERKTLIEKSLDTFEGVEVKHFSVLLVDFMKEQGACAIIRGLRAVSDFDYEYAMYQVNAELNPNIETVFLLAASEYSFLSSTIIKELARYGKGLDKYTSPIVSKALLDKFKNKKL